MHVHTWEEGEPHLDIVSHAGLQPHDWQSQDARLLYSYLDVHQQREKSLQEIQQSFYLENGEFIAQSHSSAINNPAYKIALIATSRSVLQLPEGWTRETVLDIRRSFDRYRARNTYVYPDAQRLAYLGQQILELDTKGLVQSPLKEHFYYEESSIQHLLDTVAAHGQQRERDAA